MPKDAIAGPVDMGRKSSKAEAELVIRTVLSPTRLVISAVVSQAVEGGGGPRGGGPLGGHHLLTSHAMFLTMPEPP